MFFINQHLIHTLELKKTRAVIILLIGNQNGCILLNLGYRLGMQFVNSVLTGRQLCNQNCKC